MTRDSGKLSGIATSAGLSGALKLGSMLVSFVYVPVVMGFLGIYKYGIWATLLNILSWVGMFDIGIGNGLRNKLAEAIARGEVALGRSLVSTSYAIMTAVIAIVALVGGLTAYHADWVGLLSAYECNESVLAVIEIGFLGTCMVLVLSLCSSVLYALQKTHLVNLLFLGQQVLMLVSVALAGRFVGSKSSLVCVALLYVGSNVLAYVVATLALFACERDLCLSLRAVDFSKARSLLGLGALFFVAQVASLVLYATDSLIISNLFGPEEVTVYATANKVFSAVTSLFTAMVTPFWSSTSAALACGDVRGIRTDMRRMIRLWAVFSLGATTLVVGFKPAVRIWLGRDLGFDNAFVALMALYAIVFMWNAIYSQVANGMSLMKFVTATAIVQMAVNIPLSIFLATMCSMGMHGVLLGTLMSMGISAILYPIYVNRALKKASASRVATDNLAERN